MVNGIHSIEHQDFGQNNENKRKSLNHEANLLVIGPISELPGNQLEYLPLYSNKTHN
jgi:hypothetical protein